MSSTLNSSLFKTAITFSSLCKTSSLPCLVSDKVTDDVVVSELVTKLPIDKGIEIWTEKVLLVDCTRKDVTSKIASAGYDAATIAKWMEEWYKKVII